MSVSVILHHKHGDDLHLGLRVLRAGAALDISVVDIASQIRAQSGTWFADLVVQKTEPVEGRFVLSSPTTDWPLGLLLWDVQFVEEGRKWSSPTRAIQIGRDITV